MATNDFQKITVQTIVQQPVEKVWAYWNDPKHITQWYFASPDWHAPSAQNDLTVGGKFKTRMEAKDGSFGFDFEGEYTTVEEYKQINYVLGDGRSVSTTFSVEGDSTIVTQIFDAENENAIEMQQGGWQAILNNFKKHAESE